MDLRILNTLERAERPALLAVALVAIAELALWIVPSLQPYGPAGWDKMPVTTAIGALLGSVSLALSSPGRPPLARGIGDVVGVVVFAIPALVVLSYTGLIPYYGFVPRPPVQTALAFTFVTAAFPLMRWTRGPLSVVADVAVIWMVAFVLFLFGAYAFGVVHFVGINRINLAAPQTLFCLSLIAFVMASRRAAIGRALSLLVSVGIGSQITRKVLLAVLVTPYLFFLTIQWLDDHDILSLVQSRAIAAPLIAFTTLGVLAWMGWRINHLERQLRLQSLTDGLTGVLNRRGFETVAEYVLVNARRSQTPLAVFFFDLDGLKRVNDTHGHETGSAMIAAFADILCATFRKTDVIARVGGDEFVVLAAATSDTVAELLVRLRRNVDARNAIGDVPFRVSYSDGHATLASGADGTIDDLIAEADAMMYARKARKRVA